MFEQYLSSNPMSRAKRVITVFYRHHSGGRCKRMYMMVEALLAKGYEVHYVSFSPLHLKSHPNLKPHFVKIPFRRAEGLLFWIAFSLVSPLVILSIALTKWPRAIAVFDPYYSVVSLPASLLSFTPIAVFLRGIPWRSTHFLRRSIFGKAIAFGFHCIGLYGAHKILTNTNFVRSSICRKLPFTERRIATLHDSILEPQDFIDEEAGELEDFTLKKWESNFPARKRAVAQRFDIPAKSILLATSGELNADKNLETLLRAISATENERLSLIICGDGPHRVAVESLIVGLGLAQQVVIAGWLDEPGLVVSGCDLFIMPSCQEGVSAAMLEALGAGVAVIAADIPEMREVFQNEELLFAPAHVEQLSQKLRSLTNGELDTLRSHCAAQADRLRFDWGSKVIEFVDKTK